MAHTHQSEKSRYKQLGTEGNYKNSKVQLVNDEKTQESQLKEIKNVGEREISEGLPRSYGPVQSRN